MERLSKTGQDILIIIASTLLINLLIWIPHLLNINNFYSLDFSAGFNTIFRNYDGLEYIIIAKSFYFPEAIGNIPQLLPANYYASHFPLFSILILFFAPLLGFLKSMLFVSTLFTTLSAIMFYLLVKNFKLTSQPLFLSLLFLILPARWVITHSVGSSEPIFIFFTLAAIYFFMKYEAFPKWKYIYLAGLFGMFAQITRPPGILLFLALVVYLLWKNLRQKQNIAGEIIKIFRNYHPLILIPLSLLGIFYWYSISYGDFLAYFHSGDNIHLTFPPFQVFNKTQYWVGDIWLEDVIYTFILGFLAGVLLLKQRLYLLAIFVLTYLAASSLVAHRDISRYLLPIFPFALIAFEKLLVSKEFKIVLVILLLAIYLYSQNYILSNTAPVPNLEFYD